MIVLFPYLAKVKVLLGWEALAAHNRYFVRGLLIMLTPILLIIALSYVPACLLGMDRISVSVAWVSSGLRISIYFAISNTTGFKSPLSKVQRTI
jgi:hypothetical protein